MIHVIETQDDPLTKLINDDPVRPNIPISNRIGEFSKVLVLLENNEPQSVICISFQDFIPISENELFQSPDGNPTVAVLYTVWAIKHGGGQKLVFDALNYIKTFYPSVKRVVTLSPPTNMARKFHIRNGASELQVNETTVNFEYKLDNK